MKKIALVILIVGFAIGAQAQSAAEPVAEVNNGCIPDETEEHYVTKKEKKRKNRMGAFANIDPAEQNSSSNNPYAFASNVSESSGSTGASDESDNQSDFKTVISNIRTFFSVKLFQRNL